jgi:hypothetical protein
MFQILELAFDIKAIKKRILLYAIQHGLNGRL